MTKIEDAAFPTENGRTWYHGISLRDYFAAKAMQAIVSNSNASVLTFEYISKRAWLQADAMLKERNKNV